MGFLDLFTRGDQKRNTSHFACIVKLALTDSVISEGEQVVLDRMAIQLNISDRLRKKVLKNPDKYPIEPSVNFENRIECLFNLTSMILADDEAIEKEKELLVKVTVGLGFPTKNSKEIANKAVELALNKTSLDEFTKRIKEFN